jgi:hypothetical protein
MFDITSTWKTIYPDAHVGISATVKLTVRTQGWRRRALFADIDLDSGRFACSSPAVTGNRPAKSPRWGMTAHPVDGYTV